MLTALRQALVVGHQHQRRTALTVEFEEQFDDGRARVAVEVARGFVSEQYIWLGRKRTGHGDSLLFAVGALGARGALDVVLASALLAAAAILGDTVNYVITVTNTSSVGAPDLDCTITDPLLGLNKNVTLASGANNVTNAQYVVQAGDPDPLLNTASVTCTADGVSGSVSDSDDHSVNLFQPSVTIDKSGDTLSKVGDSVDYNFTINNTSSGDSPNLVLDSITDAVAALANTSFTADELTEIDRYATDAGINIWAESSAG